MDNRIFSPEAFAEKARQIIAEGCVLLRNENCALPLHNGCRTAVFGRAQMNYFKSGLGSGGLVNTRYVTGIYEAMVRSGDFVPDEQVRAVYEEWVKDHPYEIGDGWAHHPWFQQEMPVDEGMIAAAAGRNEAAVVIIGRTAGEDRDNMQEPGSWFLTAEEEQLLELVCRHFSRSVVLLNVGNIIDMTWVEKYQPSAVMYVWQGGQEGGTGVADVLSGRISPSGRLTDTIARTISDYPSDEQFGDEFRTVYCEDIYVGYRYFETFARDKVLYAFGEGLSYTEFVHEPVSFERMGNGTSTIRHRVSNTGKCASKEVVQVYAGLPQGALGKPSLILCGYAKSGIIQPGESQEVEIIVEDHTLASYDDSGVSGHLCCTVMEAGTYRFFAGHSIRSLGECGSFELSDTIVLSEHEQACAPAEEFRRIINAGGAIGYEAAPLRRQHPDLRRAQRIPAEIPVTEYHGLKLEDVYAKRCTVNDFVAQMTDDDLCCIVRGEGMSSPRVTPGTAGAFGGVSDRLTELFGIPTVCCADGPSGIRMDCGNTAFSMPNGTLQACTWNEDLVAELYVLEGLEMRKYQVDNILGPGINIHRHPLNGRNFEYFSEDPLVTGRMAVAQLRGLEKSGVSATIKHFACNNQEFSRRQVNAVISERALREIYLPAFEMAVRKGGARSVMTSYNPLNGIWTASSYDLVTTILRGEWGFDGIVMTDWWAMGSEEGSEASVKKVASMVRAQNDLFMVTNEPAANSGEDDSAESLASGKVTRAEYQRSAVNICRFVMDTPAFRRLIGEVTPEDEQLRRMRDEDEDILLEVPEVILGEETVIDGSELNVSNWKTNIFQMKLEKHGQYRISLVCRASEAVPDTAQLPMAIFVDSQLLKAHTLNGGEKDWQTIEVTTREIRRRLIFYAKFFFAVGGLEIKEVRITRIQTFD